MKEQKLQTEYDTMQTKSKFDKATVEQLAAKAKHGDKQALMALCERIVRGVLFRISCRLSNQMDAEDASQEVLIRVCEGIGNLKDPKAFGGWLNRIIVNETNRFAAKTSKISNVVNIDEYIENDFEDDDESFLPDEYTVRAEDREIVMGIIKNLPDRQMEAVMLFYYEGMNVTEAAEAMGLAKANVSRYLALARDKIRSEIEILSEEKKLSSGFAILPIGGILTRVLRDEANIGLGTSEPWIRSAMTQFATGSKALRGGLGISALFASTTAKVAVGIIAACIVTAGLYFGGMLSPKEPPAVGAGTGTGTIVFVGTDIENSHINPSHVELITGSDYGELVVQGWKISTADTNDVILSGNGNENISSVISGIEKDGNYILSYSLKDAEGRKYTLSRSFIITEN